MNRTVSSMVSPLKKAVLASLLLVLLCGAAVQALPYLDPQYYEDIVIQQGSEKTSFNVIRDDKDEFLWYYIPKSPQLAMEGNKPIFHLLKIQTDKPGDNRGILQFAINLALPGTVQDSIKASLAQKRKIDQSKIKLTCIPLTKTDVTIYDMDGDMVASGPQMPGIAPTFANQDMIFQLRLKELGVDVYDALVNKQTGIPIYVTYKYMGVSPKCGFKVDVNWDQLYTDYSTSEKTKKTVGCWLWSRTETSTIEKVVSELTSNKKIQVQILGSDQYMKDEEIQTYLEPIMKRINDELLVAMKPPEKVTPASAPDPSGGGWFGGGGSSYAMKDVKQTKKGHEEIVFEKQMIIEQQTGCGTFVSIGKYPEDVKKDLVTVMPKGNWAQAMFTLPSVGDDPSLGINSINLTVSIVDGKKQPVTIPTDNPTAATTMSQKMVTWTQKTGNWRSVTEGDKNLNSLYFPMAYFYSKLKADEINALQYKSVMTITTKFPVQTLEITKYQPLVEGDLPLTDPIACVEPATVYCSALKFLNDDPNGDLRMITAAITSKYPNKTQTSSLADLKTRKNLTFLIERRDDPSENPVKAKILFVPKIGKNIEWSGNALPDIRSDYPTLEYYAFPTDYQTPTK